MEEVKDIQMALVSKMATGSKLDEDERQVFVQGKTLDQMEQLKVALENVGVNVFLLAITIKEGLEACYPKGSPDYKTRAKFVELVNEIFKPEKKKETNNFKFIVNKKTDVVSHTDNIDLTDYVS